MSTRAFALRPVFIAAPRQSLSTSSRFLASSDYGSGEGDPVSENPQKQGVNPSADIEHPGPPPPKVGRGTGSSPTKGTSDGHNTGGSSAPSSSSSSSSSNSAGSSGSDGSGSSGGGGKKKPQPKILDHSPPADPSEDVKQHNREMENRADRAHEKIDEGASDKDNVSKGYWSGKWSSEPTMPFTGNVR